MGIEVAKIPKSSSSKPRVLSSMTRKEVADTLKYAAVMYFSKKGYAVNLEQGVNKWGQKQADVLALNLKSEIVIGEVKSCYSDFKSDRKWKDYLQYCNKLYFIVLDIDLERMKEHFEEFKKLGIGVLSLCTERGHYWEGWLYVALNAKNRKLLGKIKKSIICRMAWRGAEYSKRNTRRYRIHLTR